MNLGQIKDMALQLIDEYSSNGELISGADNADVLNKMTNLANAAQAQISEFAKIRAVHEIVQYPINNLLGESYDIHQHTGEDLEYESDTPAKAYYFEVDGEATVYVEELSSGWQVLETINVPGTVAGFTAYKGLINASNPNNKTRLRFSGSYPYNTRNRALYEFAFSSADKVPAYQEEVKYDLPSDFWQLENILFLSTNSKRFTEFIHYTFRDGTLFIPRSFKGEFRVNYFKKPVALVEDADVPEIDSKYHHLIAQYVAAMVLVSRGETSKGTQLRNFYEVELYRINGDDGSGPGYIKDAIGW